MSARHLVARDAITPQDVVLLIVGNNYFNNQFPRLSDGQTKACIPRPIHGVGYNTTAKQIEL